jgi:hypothetical protein
VYQDLYQVGGLLLEAMMNSLNYMDCMKCSLLLQNQTLAAQDHHSSIVVKSVLDWTENPGVGGSIPSRGTIFLFFFY